jgi:hypothetical protein
MANTTIFSPERIEADLHDWLRGLWLPNKIHGSGWVLGGSLPRAVVEKPHSITVTPTNRSRFDEYDSVSYGFQQQDVAPLELDAFASGYDASKPFIGGVTLEACTFSGNDEAEHAGVFAVAVMTERQHLGNGNLGPWHRGRAIVVPVGQLDEVTFSIAETQG